MFPPEDGDLYIDDAIHYHLAVMVGVLVTDDRHLEHGYWWWSTQCPPEQVRSPTN